MVSVTSMLASGTPVGSSVGGLPRFRDKGLDRVFVLLAEVGKLVGVDRPRPSRGRPPSPCATAPAGPRESRRRCRPRAPGGRARSQGLRRRESRLSGSPGRGPGRRTTWLIVLGMAVMCLPCALGMLSDANAGCQTGVTAVPVHRSRRVICLWGRGSVDRDR